jgi:hypothetical protein
MVLKTCPPAKVCLLLRAPIVGDFVSFEEFEPGCEKRFCNDSGNSVPPCGNRY